MKNLARGVAACSMIVGAALLADPAQAQPQTDSSGGLVGAIRAGKPILEFRPRYESAEQGALDGEALTLRTRLGWETAAWNGFKGLIEFEDVRQIGGDYNDGVPPAEPFATIADPDVTEINRAQIAWTPNPDFTATLGRQRIAFDDQRFVGSVAWRQDEQTFDAARFDLTLGKFSASYAYVDQVNRVFAEDLDWDGETHLFNASYALAPPLKLTGFAYLLDFDAPAAGQSSATYGVRASGRIALSALKLDYAVTYATQEDYGGNPAAFDLDYLGAEASATYGIVSGRLMFEELEGNGARGFATPLATLHAFNGWADVFLATPADGLTDLNVTASVRPPIEAAHFSKLALTARWHDFEAERTGADLGEELDLQATASITPRLGVLLKYADYDGVPGSPPDTTRIWLGFEFKL